MLLRKCAEKFVHLSAGLRIESSLFGTIIQCYYIRYFGNGLRLVTGGASMCVRNLVRGNSVHKGHERASLVLITRQRGHHGQTDFLCDVVSGQVSSLGRTHSTAAQ